MIDKEFMDKYLNYLNKIGCTEYKDILLAIGVANKYDIEDMLTSNDSEFNRVIGGTQGSGTLTEVGKYRLLNDLIYCIGDVKILPSMENTSTVKKIVSKNFDIRNTYKELLDIEKCKKQLNFLNCSYDDLDPEICEISIKLGKLLNSFIHTNVEDYIIHLPFKYKQFILDNTEGCFEGCKVHFNEEIVNADLLLDSMTACCLKKAANMDTGQTMYVSTLVDEVKKKRTNRYSYIALNKPRTISGVNTYEYLKYTNKSLFDFLSSIFTFDCIDTEYKYANVACLMTLLAHVPKEEICNRLEELKL